MTGCVQKYPRTLLLPQNRSKVLFWRHLEVFYSYLGNFGLTSLPALHFCTEQSSFFFGRLGNSDLNKGFWCLCGIYQLVPSCCWLKTTPANWNQQISRAYPINCALALFVFFTQTWIIPSWCWSYWGLTGENPALVIVHAVIDFG